MGINKMYEVPRHMAEKLGFDNSVVLEFKGHSMRSTSATLMSDSGCTLPQLRQKLNHNSDKVNTDF